MLTEILQDISLNVYARTKQIYNEIAKDKIPMKAENNQIDVNVR